MESIILTFHIILCLLLIVAVLLQAGKGADIGAVFGGAGSQTLFGARGPATFLNKATIVIAVFFLATSLTMAQLAKNKSQKSVIDNAAVESLILDEAEDLKIEENK